jgi:hypothetical protein
MRLNNLLKCIIFISLAVLMSCSKEKKNEGRTAYRLEIRPVENKSTLEKVFPIIKDSLSLVALFLGMYLTYPLLKKKLVENHITATLQKIQDTNRRIQINCQKLIDKYVSLSYSNEGLRELEIEKAYNDIKKLYYEAQESSSDILTLLFYVKNTLQGVLKHYEYGKYWKKR